MCRPMSVCLSYVRLELGNLCYDHIQISRDGYRRKNIGGKEKISTFYVFGAQIR